uniref:Uncharacterized protein n=1 Tax=Arundo donax TaxID=35708 RepID=A0A0A8Z6C0_ARUDO
MKRRTKEREKKLRRREKLKEKGKDKGKRLVESKSPYRISSSALSNSSASTNDESTNTLDSRDSASEEEDNALVVDLCSPDRCIDQFSCRDINGENNVSSDCCISKQSKSLKQSPRLRKDFLQDESCWYDDSKDEPQWQLKERTRNRARRCHSISSANYGRDRHEYNSCNCDHQEDYRVTGSCFLSTAVSGREMKMARKAGVEKPRVQYRGCYTLDSFIVPNGCHVGSTQKNAIPKEAWETLDAPKKTSLDKTDNASGSVDNVDLLKPVDCDTSGCEKLGVGCEPVPLASESSGNLYKSETYQPCGELSKAASCEETLMMNKQDCNSTNDEGSRLMTNSTCSDSSSSCKREGDRESSSSSMTSSSTQNPESSSSESEESPNSTLYTTSLRTASCSLLETCARNGFREYRPKATRLAQNDRFGFNVSPFQGQLLHHPNMHVPPHSSAIMGLRNHSWAAPTDGNSSPRVLGVPGKQSVYPVRCVASVFGHIRPEPIHEAAASFRAIPPSPPCQNGTQHIAGHPHTDMNTKMHPSDLKPLSQKDPPEDKNTSQDTDAPFSLFQFNLPIVSPAPPSSKYDKTGELAARTPLAQVQAQLCSKEQTDVKEYNLFSTKDSGISFSFM